MEILQLRRRRPGKRAKETPVKYTYTRICKLHFTAQADRNSLQSNINWNKRNCKRFFFAFEHTLFAKHWTGFIPLLSSLWLCVLKDIQSNIQNEEKDIEKERNLFRWMPFFICTFVDVLYGLSLSHFFPLLSPHVPCTHTVCHAK